MEFQSHEHALPSRQITDIPEEIIELVFSHLSPYSDFKNVMMVCKQWHHVITGLIKKIQRNFHQMLRQGEMNWKYVSNFNSVSITDRHSHSACYFEHSMYVFGGLSATSTTFNDLWRFDLATRQWIRPLAMAVEREHVTTVTAQRFVKCIKNTVTECFNNENKFFGTYPSPKACATMVVYKDSLVLYGGWSRPTPMPLHQAPRFFSEIHLYTPSTNRWSQIMAVSNDSLHRLAGHSASVIDDTMVIFGGSHDSGTGCNDVWIFDFVQTTWKKTIITGKKPHPRYGQAQKTIDSEHILIIGGCGGANQTFSDAWLLHLVGNEGTWEEVTITNADFCPTQMWSHPACMVKDMAVCISKNSRVRGSNPEAHNVLLQNRVWIPPPAPMAPQQAINPHIPPPLPFPPMAAFQRRRGNWGGGFGPPVVRNPPNNPQNVELHARVHGAYNPNILDVQRLRNAQSRSNTGAQRAFAAEPSQPQPSGSNGGMGSTEVGTLSGNLPQVGPCGSGILYEKSGNAGVTCRPSAEKEAEGEVSVLEDMCEGAQAPRPGLPSVRPNAMHNRQRQLDMLCKHEHILRSRNNTHNNNRSASVVLPRNPMVIHVLDLSQVAAKRTATWLPVREAYVSGSPEETIFFSLVEGRGELVFFGGIHNNHNSMQRANVTPQSSGHSVSNGMYIISPRLQPCHRAFVKHH